MVKLMRPVRILKIERRPCTGPVYNLAVEEDESYVADGVVVHNCRSILVAVPLGVPMPKEDFATNADIGAAKDLIPAGFGGSA